MTLVATQIAPVVHEADRALCEQAGRPGIPAWADLLDDDRAGVHSLVARVLGGGDAVDQDADLPELDELRGELIEAIVSTLGDVADQPTPDLSERHPSVAGVARFLLDVNPRLPAELAHIARICRILAVTMLGGLEDGPELTAGLRKLLEAKDCFVRAAL